MKLSCRETVRLISEGMDRRLPFWNRIGLRLHILICTWCQRYRGQLLFIRDAVRRHPDELVGAEQAAASLLSPEARERIRQAIIRQSHP